MLGGNGHEIVGKGELALFDLFLEHRVGVVDGCQQQHLFPADFLLRAGMALSLAAAWRTRFSISPSDSTFIMSMPRRMKRACQVW